MARIGERGKGLSGRLMLPVAVLCVACSCSAAGGDGAALGAGRWVSDPYRAVDVRWPRHFCKGQDYRFLLKEEFFDVVRGTPLADEPFVREAGYLGLGIVETTEGGERLLAVQAVEARDAKGGAVPCAFTLSSTDPGAVVERNVVSSPIYDIGEKYKPARGRLAVTASAPAVELRVRTGLSPASRAEAVACANATLIAGDDGTFVLRFARPLTEFDLMLTGRRYRHRVGGLRNASPELLARLRAVPFEVRARDRGIYGLDADSVDLSGYDRLEEEFPDTYLGSTFGEWDGTVLFRLARVKSAHARDLAQIGTFPCTREGMVGNFRRVWDLAQSQKGRRMSGMSVSALGPAYSCEWGSTLNMLELTSEQRENPFRALLMHQRGASRQFGVPMGVYTAYYRGPCTAHSDPGLKSAGGTRFGEDFGRAPNLSLREHFVAYYMGNGFQSFECQPWGQLKRLDDGSLALTGNGCAMKAVYDWYRSGRGERGRSYASVLFLKDRASGCDCLMGSSRANDRTDYGAFYGSFPPNASDHLCEYAVEALTPYVPPSRRPADFSDNLRNSTLADVFDVHTANPLRPDRALTLEQVSRYPVVMPISEIRWTEGLAVVLKNYVANGGTLVLTTGHLAPYADDLDFLGAQPTGARTADDGLLVDRLDVRDGATVEMRTTTGLPLIVRNAFGDGCVLLVASPLFAREKDRETVPPQFVALLERLQAETLPVRVKGACEALYNVCEDGSWRIVLVNNAGVEKKADETRETIHPEFAAEVTLELPKDAAAEEIRLGAPVAKTGDRVALTVPPGEICVLKVTGLPAFGAKRFPSRTPVTLKRPFVPEPERPRHPDDDYKYDPSNVSFAAPPAVIGRWLKRDGFKDSSGQGNDPKDWADSLEIAVKAPYSTFRGTFDAVVTPSADSLRTMKKRTELDGVLRVKDVYVGIRDGCWRFFRETAKHGFVARLCGPKAETRPTCVRLTFDRGFWRCFVDGKELLQPEGPVKADYEQFADTFYGKIDVLFGKAVSHRAHTAFHGELGSLEIRSE